MSAGSTIVGVFIIACIVVGMIFAANYYTGNKSPVTDTYGNITGEASNSTSLMVSNITATGESVESGFLILVAVMAIIALIVYFVFKR